MDVHKLNFIFRFFDFLLWPCMWILGGFVFPVQETHPWHVKKWNWKSVGVNILGNDSRALFGQSGISKYFGIYHMPIFGGLKKYVVLENNNFKKYWNIGWNGRIQILKIYEPKIALLAGKEGYKAFAISDDSNETKLKIIAFGELGDGKYNSIRLF